MNKQKIVLLVLVIILALGIVLPLVARLDLYEDLSGIIRFINGWQINFCLPGGYCN